VEWLVRYHLLMSDMAQKRDIGDPRTVRDFAKAVKTRKRLDLLTGADRLRHSRRRAGHLEQLEGHAAAPAVQADDRGTGRRAGNPEPREPARGSHPRAAPNRLAGWDDAAPEHETTRHYAPYWQGLSTDTHEVFARLLQGLGDDEIRIDLHPDADRDATRAAFRAG
jgi:[protein-PII] uridylyltransferase